MVLIESSGTMRHIIVLLGLTTVLATPVLCAMDFARTGECEVSNNADVNQVTRCLL